MQDPRHFGSPGSWRTFVAKFSVNLGQACEIKQENSRVLQSKKFFFYKKPVTNTIDKTLSHDDGQRIYRQYSKQWNRSNNKKVILNKHYKLASKTKIAALQFLHMQVVQQDYKSKMYPKEPSQFRDLISFNSMKYGLLNHLYSLFFLVPKS